jgi:hypothetical protein
MDGLMLTLAEQDEQDFAVALWYQMMGLAAPSVCEESQAGGSLPGQVATKDRDFVADLAFLAKACDSCCHTRPSLPLLLGPACSSWWSATPRQYRVAWWNSADVRCIELVERYSKERDVGPRKSERLYAGLNVERRCSQQCCPGAVVTAGQ